MPRLSDKKKLENYMARKAESRREQERIENNKDYQPEVEGYLPDRR